MAWRYRLAAAQTQHLLQKVLRKRTGFTRGCKMKRLFHLLPASFLILGLARFASAQSTPYPGEDLPKVYDRLLSKINAIPIYDNHAHPGFADDNDVDAMASPPDESSVLRLRDDNPEFVTASTPDMGVYIPLQEKMLVRYKKQMKVDSLPADLAGYENFVRNTMADNQKRGGVAIKFEAAYFRTLYFSDPPREKADAIYAKYHSGGVPAAEDYRLFQDYIFRVIVDQAGKLKLPVHFHSAVGIGDYFSLRQGNVLNLENVLRDARYKNVVFVLLHGGWPYEREAALLTAVKNVYLDTSLQSEMLYPSQFKSVLKQFLTLYPDKMMFGSDAFPFNEALGAEESFWLAAHTSRTALAGALAELVSERAISEDKALELAHLYLHDNAAKLYGGTK